MRTKIKTLNRFAFAGKGTVSGDMALDLLEAREIIKEMREIIQVYVSVNTCCTCGFCEKERTILERTKDYAE